MHYSVRLKWVRQNSCSLFKQKFIHLSSEIVIKLYIRNSYYRKYLNMSYNIEAKKLKRIIDFYAPYNNGEEMKFMHYLKGQQEIYKCLETSPFQGITIDSIDERISWFGSNENISPVETKSVLQNLLYPFEFMTFKVKFFFSILCLTTGIFLNYNDLPFPYFQGLFCLIALFIVYILMLIPHISKKIEYEKLAKYSQKVVDCTVWRENKRIIISSNEVVVGDVIQLNEGDSVVADGWIIEGSVRVQEIVSYEMKTGNKMTMKESINSYWMRTEKEIVNKKYIDQNELQATPVVLSGSNVISGSGKMIALCIGKYSRRGQFISLIQESTQERKSELQKKLEDVVFKLTKKQLLSVLILIILFIIKFIINRFRNNDWKSVQFTNILSKLAQSFSLILLPSTICIIIGLSIGLMYIKYKLIAQHNIIVKRAFDCESMASVSTICYEKINDPNFFTLRTWWNQEIYLIQSPTSENNEILASETQKEQPPPHPLFQYHFQNSLKKFPIPPSQMGFQVQSYFTWKGQRIQSFMSDTLLNYQRQRQKVIKISQQELQLQKQQEGQNKRLQYIYGSAQILLPHFTHLMLKSTGQLHQLMLTDILELKKMINDWGLKDDYCMATGYLQIDPQYPSYRDPKLKSVLLSIILYQDNRNRRQFQSVINLQNEGINIIMVSINQHENAVGLSKQLGLIKSGQTSISLKGYDFHNIIGGIICNNCKKYVCHCFEEGKYESILKNKDQFQRISKHLNVVSQAQFTHKLSLITGLNNKNHYTCLVGTRKQDIPAMMASHLPLIFEDEVQDQQLVNAAAKIVIPENSIYQFSVLLSFGQKAHLFIKKYLLLVIIGSNVSFFVNFICFVLVGGLTLKMIQVIWVHIILFPLLAFAMVDNEQNKNQQRKSAKKGQPLLQANDHKIMNCQIIYQIIVLIVVVFFGHMLIPEDMDDVDKIIGNDWSAKYNDDTKTTIAWGVKESILTEQEVFERSFKNYHIFSRHLTIVFNVYAFMQIFNFFNCRKLEENQFNIFSNFTVRTLLFFLLAFSFQIICVQFGSQILGLYPYGLTIKQWTFCIGLSLSVWVINFLIKLVPKDNESDENKKHYWPNKSYNLAVMTVTSKEALIQFEVDDDFMKSHKKQE